jgi:thioredoxin reductase
LSAALVLGRARRSVLVCDLETPRNWASKKMHGFLTREGVHPRRFLALARRELAGFPSVELRRAEVSSVAPAKSGFVVSLDGRRSVRSRKVLIATGVHDVLPPIPGVESYFGRSVFQCPYCDGWEWQDQPVAVYGKSRRGFEMARAMTAWTSDIVVCTDGRSGFSAAQQASLERNGVDVVESKIARLDGTRGRLEAIVFRGGDALPRTALFFDLPTRGQSRLGELIGCEVDRNGRIECGKYEATQVPGVFVAGNVIDDVQFSIVAAAEGARAGFGINRALTREDFERPRKSSRD